MTPLQRLQNYPIQVIRPPKRVGQLHTPPPQLYVRGPLPELLTSPVLAVVGSRRMTPYGRKVTEALAAQAAQQGICILSGLALGVDSCAQSAALAASGKVIAVLPSDVTHIYPAAHLGLALRILEGGGVLVSQYQDSSEGIQKYQFIERNAIIASLSDATLITEAAKRSGSLHTADFALDLGRPVLAVPGSIHSPVSEGCNTLLKSAAFPCTGLQDILDALGLQLPNKPHIPQGASKEEQTVLQALQSGHTGFSDIVAVTGMTAGQCSVALGSLEIAGVVASIGPQWSITG